MKRVLACMLAAAALAGCETTTPTTYQAAPSREAVGYSETRLEPGRYRVTFQGGPGAPDAQIEDYALLRAAELAVRDGYDWFQVSERFTERSPPRNRSSISIGTGGGDFGRHGGVGVGVGTTFDLSGGPQIRRSFEVLMGKGPKPSGADAYDARGVLNEVGPRVRR